MAGNWRREWLGETWVEIVRLPIVLLAVLLLLPVIVPLIWLGNRQKVTTCAACGQRDEIIDGLRFKHQCYVRGA